MDETRLDPEERENTELPVQQTLISRIQKLSQDIERLNMAEYISLINDPGRFMKINFAAGLARGLGFALGATFFAALVIYILQRMMVLNLPLIGDFIADLVKIVQEHL
ncbi:MAG: DUF5665 domain-containing protein [Dethiobacteria bacterium]